LQTIHLTMSWYPECIHKELKQINSKNIKKETGKGRWHYKIPCSVIKPIRSWKRKNSLFLGGLSSFLKSPT
jgi:hypothetical protein